MIKNYKKQNVVICGGGYLGLMIALMLSNRRNVNVIIVERQTNLGGLYNTAYQKDEFYFDHGSRAILQTGVKELDDVIFSLLPDDQYQKTTENLREFSFQHGKYCNYSNCLDARLLPAKVFERGKTQMLNIAEVECADTGSTNLQKHCLSTYGEIFTRELIEPVMVKLTGSKLENLDKSALLTHGLNRVIIADQQETMALKSESDFNNSRIAYSRYDDNNSKMIKTYPLFGGLSDYIKRLTCYLSSRDNVSIKTQTTINKLISEKDKIQAIVTDDAQIIPCDHLFWTIPSVFFAKLANIDVSDIDPPRFLDIEFSHMVFKGQLNTNAHFVYNYDDAYSIYRSTFYNNYTAVQEGFGAITVEKILFEELTHGAQTEKEILDQLIMMDLLHPGTELVWAHTQLFKNGWPAFDFGFGSSQDELNRRAIGVYDNVHIVGKSNGKHHSGALARVAHVLIKELFG